MAAATLADVSAALSLVFRPALKTQINSVVVLPFLLPVLNGEGKALYWTAEFTGATNAVATAEGVALSSTDADDEDELPATLGWAQYTKVSSVTDLAQAAAGTNYNPRSLMGDEGGVVGDLLLQRTFRQTRRMALGIAGNLYSGDPTATPTQVAGAAIAIDSSGAFAGIDPAVEAEWAAFEDTQTLASLSFSSLRQFFTAIYDNCGFYPEFCTVPSNVFDAIRDLYTNFEANVRSVREFQLSRGGGMRGTEPRAVELAAGMRAVEVDGVIIVLDPAATANTIYAWHTEHVAIRELPFDPVRSALARGSEGVLGVFRRLDGNDLLTLPREDVEGMMARSPGLNPFIKALGDRGMSSEAVIGWFGQVEYTRRNAFGKKVLT